MARSDAPGDLSTCDSEPIHAPGGVQPHARMVVLNAADGLPIGFSANWPGGTARALRAFSSESREEIAAFLGGGPAPEALTFEAEGEWAAHCFRSGGAAFIELEPEGSPREALGAMRRGDAAMRALRAAGDYGDLIRVICDAVCDLTACDRVMVYRFDDEWNGEVVAETARRAAPDSFLGLKFPASDIPAQARALFLRNRVRQIPDVAAEPVAVAPDRDPIFGAPLDMSDARARAVSPIHLEYLRNMGVTASLTIALIVRERLWGLIACHHYRGPLYVPPALRATCVMLCEAFSARLSAWLGARLANRLEGVDARLSARLAAAQAAADASAGEGFEPFLRARAAELLALCDADAGLFTVGEDRYPFGPVAPELLIVGDLLAQTARPPGSRFATSDLTALGALPTPEIAGVCVAQLTGARGRLTLFRHETPLDESWAGDPDKRAIPGPGARLHPRRSFERFMATRRGRSRPWSEADVKAAALMADRLFAWKWRFVAARREALIGRLGDSEAAAQRLAAVAERANDMVIVTGPDGLTTWANRAVARHTGYDVDDLKGRKPGDVLQGADTDPIEKRRIGDAIRARQPVRSTLLNYTRAGQPYWVELDIAPVFGADGAVRQFIAIERDVTVAREREAALSAALARVQAADGLKSDFLRMVSHEIRTPLNGVIGLASILNHHLAATEYAPLARQITTSGRDLLALFETIVDLAQARHGDALMNLGPVDAAALAETIAQAHEPHAMARGLTFAFEPGDEAVHVRADVDRLRQVLALLAANAIKFTDTGGVTMTTRRDAATNMGVMSVIDTGPGVPADLREAVFEPFRQGDQSMSRRNGGLGLGLPLARTLVEAMGGALTIEDREGGGAIFRIALPLAATAEPGGTSASRRGGVRHDR
jgi:PAS domain S-box-containing protein